MKSRLACLTFLILALMFAAPPTPSHARPLAAASSYGGTYSSWPTSWIAVNGLNDGNDIADGAQDKLDFVGDSSNPGFYFTSNSEYIFFRVRVDDGAVTEFSDTLLILIDYQDDNDLDYAFMWDTQSADQTKHGLEMGLLRDIGSSWKTTRMKDADTDSAAKTVPPDFGLNNGDGYVRIVNGETTANFGTTTFVDFAIKWSYLTGSSGTPLAKGQTWGIQLASIAQANDHNWFDADIAGGQSLDNSPTSFPGTVQFKATAVTLRELGASNQAGGLTYGMLGALLAIVGVALLIWRRRSLLR